MDLLPSELKAKIPPIGATEGQGGKAKIVVKYFLPGTGWTWYATEGQEEQGDFTFWGVVVGMETEYGYWMLSELQGLKVPLKLNGQIIRGRYFTVERDLYYQDHTIGEILDLEVKPIPSVND